MTKDFQIAQAAAYDFKPGQGACAVPLLPEIKGFLETSFIDWRGQVAAVLFLPGCNFNCPYCHNHLLVNESDSLETLPFMWVMERLGEFSSWIDGVVVSGGEPCLHHGLAELLAGLKAKGFKTKLDTNGSQPDVLENLLEQNLLDMVAMDWKAPLAPALHRKVTGARTNLDHLRRSRDIILSSGLEHEFRSTIWPAWHSKAELMTMRAELKGAKRWTLQAMTPHNVRQPELFAGCAPFSTEELAELQAELAY